MVQKERWLGKVALRNGDEGIQQLTHKAKVKSSYSTLRQTRSNIIGVSLSDQAQHTIPRDAQS